MCTGAAVSAAIAEIARFAPPPAAVDDATSSVAGSRRLPSTSPTRPPASATRKHQTREEGEVHDYAAGTEDTPSSRVRRCAK